MKKLIMIMSASLLLGSCGLYNKYDRPDVNTTGLVRDVNSLTDTLAVTDTTSFGNMPWRSVFTDPQLQSLIETGLANNPDLLNAALNVKMIKAQLMAARLAFVPSFTFSPQGTLSSWWVKISIAALLCGFIVLQSIFASRTKKESGN